MESKLSNDITSSMAKYVNGTCTSLSTLFQAILGFVLINKHNTTAIYLKVSKKYRTSDAIEITTNLIKDNERGVPEAKNIIASLVEGGFKIDTQTSLLEHIENISTGAESIHESCL